MNESEIEAQLIRDIGSFTHDPVGFVRYVFPWGVEGTELETKTGPRKWQIKILNTLADQLKSGMDPANAMATAIQIAVASGHGIGKSALVSWIILWGLSTHVDTKVVVTANTEAQLTKKTWPEVAKWHRLAINSEWFKFTATSLFSTDPKHEKTWRADAIPWSERNTEAFAGLHNEGKRIIVIFDEASAIPDPIWEVTEGALTDDNTEIMWCVFGNPTRNTGRFRECFGRLKHRWDHWQIDSRTVEGTNKAQFEEWLEDHGEDSDFFRVRVRGQFPASSALQFIGSDIANEARTREAESYLGDPLIMGVDVARFGDDESIIQFRRGKDAQTIPPIVINQSDLMYLVGRIISAKKEHGADEIFVDAGGVGGGVIDRLLQMGHDCIEVHFGGKPDSGVLQETSARGEQYSNKTGEMWGAMRAWLRDGGAIADDPDLEAQLVGREYKYNEKNQIVMEKKSDMKKRGLSSPDRADALAMTFAYPVEVDEDCATFGESKWANLSVRGSGLVSSRSEGQY
jgi:hypothetical protein